MIKFFPRLFRNVLHIGRNGQLQFGKDFNFLIESIVDAFLSPLLLNENLNHSLTFLRPGGKIHSKAFLRPSGNKQDEYSRLLRKANDVVSSGNMSLEDLKKFPIEYFSKGLST